MAAEALNVKERKKEILQLVIKPIIEKSLIKKLLIRREIFGLTLEHIKISFKIKIKNNVTIPDKITIRDLIVNNEKFEGLTTTYSDIIEFSKIDIEKGKKGKGKLEVLFPYSGVWWIDGKVSAEPNNYDIETFQIQLLQKEGRGWPEGSAKNVIRMPLCIIDNINFKLNLYTVMILILAILTLVLNILIKN